MYCLFPYRMVTATLRVLECYFLFPNGIALDSYSLKEMVALLLLLLPVCLSAHQTLSDYGSTQNGKNLLPFGAESIRLEQIFISKGCERL